ncbi:MAG: hypothetical protein KF678_11645 [Phycisphaeraceae bacterium]|nr:hypothetical protein [Phycisphaeraceae bacterium]
MLTPAEESGLAGLRLAGRVQRALSGFSPQRLGHLVETIQQQAKAQHLIYQHEGVTETIRILPCPVTIRPDQLAYIHSVSLTILNALKRLPDIYQQNFAVRELLRLSPGEEQWLWDCWGPSQRENNPMFGRLDAMVDFTSPMWKDSLRFVEPNLTGIGGLHLGPTSDRVLYEIVVPELLKEDPGLRLELAPDMRELLIQELLDHLEVVGRPRGTIALIDPKFEQDGPDEQDRLVSYFTQRHQLRVVHVDPSELKMKGREVYYNDLKIDIGYRDYGVLDLIDLARRGIDVEPMRTLFRENRMVSSIAAELDQKSCWEVLTDPALAQQFFSPEERQVIRRHICWTRILSDRRTTNPKGEPCNLVEFAREEHEGLVLKPNRAFGGKGVVVGPSVTPAEWNAAIDAALADTGSDRWVVQELASIPVREFPVLSPEGRVVQEPFYVVLGFAASKYGVALMARASQKQVVNVAQRGGVCAVLVGHEGR